MSLTWVELDLLLSRLLHLLIALAALLLALVRLGALCDGK